MRVGVIGLGVGGHHVRTSLAHPLVEDVVVCDFQSEKVAAFTALERVRAAESVERFLRTPGLDVLVVASYDEYHAEQVVRALDAGLSVFVEKPMCLTRGQGESVLGALRGSGRSRLSSNLCLRTSPLFEEVREAISSGAMGSVCSMQGDYIWGRPEKLVRGWRANTPGYSVIHGAAVHMVDLLMWIAPSRPVEVHALGNARALAHAGLGFDDFVSLHLRFEDGLVARVSACAGAAHPHFHRVEVYGSQASFANDLSGGWWTTREGGRSPAAGEYPARERRSLVLRSFLDAVAGGGEPLVSERDVFDVMDVCLAAQESLERGVAVPVEYSFERRVEA